jgi:hypothetical protein
MATYSCETSDDFQQTTRRYMPEDRTLESGQPATLSRYEPRTYICSRSMRDAKQHRTDLVTRQCTAQLVLCYGILQRVAPLGRSNLCPSRRATVSSNLDARGLDLVTCLFWSKARWCSHVRHQVHFHIQNCSSLGPEVCFPPCYRPQSESQSVTLRLAFYRRSVRLGANPLRPTTSIVFFN